MAKWVSAIFSRWCAQLVVRPIILFIALVVSQAADAAHETVALTFDDLPTLSLLKAQSYATYTSEKLLRGLKRHHLPAIGFVNEGKLDDLVRSEQIEILRKWRDAGMQLGNHTFSHISANTTTAEAYIADIARGEMVTRELLEHRGGGPRWFRHPYLETGMPLAERDKIEAWLAAHGYKIAPVTMENSDWLFSEPYDDALARRDDARAARIKAVYLRYTARIIPWYQSAARALLGRPMAYVFLLHASRLNADSLDDIARLLKRNKLHAVTLERAMLDPAYLIADNYAGSEGMEWLSRWALTLHKELPWETFKEPPKDIEAEYSKIDSDH